LPFGQDGELCEAFNLLSAKNLRYFISTQESDISLLSSKVKGEVNSTTP
jgi:hypothetical protein